MTIFFNAFHSPIGAHSSFTLGCKGQKGGLGLERGEPACENIYIGLQDCNEKNYNVLPFYEGVDDESKRYFDNDDEKQLKTTLLTPYQDSDINRKFKTGSDVWNAGDLTCSIYSQAMSAPDPANSSESEQMFAYCPAVIVELKIDNRNCDNERLAFMGYSNTTSTDSMHFMYNLPNGLKGVGIGNNTAIITNAGGAEHAQGFSMEDILNESTAANYQFGLGETGALIFKAPAGQLSVFKIALCFYRAGIVTSGVPTSYWYSRFFDSIEHVGAYALENFDKYKKNAINADTVFDAEHLNDAQRFHIAHATRSYYGSTQLLDWDGKPFWVVNEGEYRMMNTFDLTVDQLFFEMKMNPWTVKNELNMFAERYSYNDKLHFPGGENIHSGGISFTHDMGKNNHISRPQHSTYEMFNLDGCFSHMTHEQLVNWVLCGAVYAKLSGDALWLKNNINVFEQCLESLMNRDNPDPAKRNGLMTLDSSRTMNGAEITTYDSLDTSLGQARNNVYIAVKSWAAYLALAEIIGTSKAVIATEQAEKAAKTISSFLQDGHIPAIMGEDCDAKIIPAIEGLVFPYILGMNQTLSDNGKYSDLIKALKTHFSTIMQKGICLYPDNGWKLSSTADNSWLSKIYLCQFVARKILGFQTAATTELADKAHMKWLLNEENIFYAWSDQMKSGIAHGSKYYPRGVTNILWLNE